MKYKILIILCLTWFYSYVEAQTVSRTDAVAIAKKYMATSQTLVEKTVDSVYCIERNGKKLLFEVRFSDGEMVIVSGNKRCKPVLACQYESDVDNTSILENYNDIPEGLKCFLDEYIEQIEYSYENIYSIGVHPDWYNLLNNSEPHSDRSIIVPPLTNTQWGQSESNCTLDEYAYNYYVSESTNDCSHCYAGCGPVALAQIMCYWHFPVWDPQMESQFDWCNMPEKLMTTSPNYLKQKYATAWLIRKSGKQMNADYCSNGDCSTSTTIDSVPNALSYFLYSSSNCKSKDDYLDEEWKSLIKLDLNRFMPVYYRGSSNNGGHAFVCDGYNSDDMFHFNWGWNGHCNGLWLTLDNLITDNVNFTSNQKAVFNIKPLTEDDFCGYSMLLEHYYMGYYLFHNGNNNPYEITPSVFFSLTSVHDSTVYPASWRTIPSGATAEYVAHEEVILLSGFTAEYGSDFTARIEPCEACEERMVQMDIFLEGDTNSDIDTSDYNLRMLKSGDTSFVFRPSALTMFPNPSTQTVTLQTSGDINDIQIFDQSGRPVFRWYIESRSNTEITLNIGDIPVGTYILRIIDKDRKMHIGRIVKK